MTESPAVRRITTEVERRFAFLLERGFRVLQVEEAEDLYGYWLVILASSSVQVRIRKDPDRTTLELAPAGSTDPKQRIPIERLINLLSDGQQIVVPFRDSLGGGKRGRLDRLARLLQDHLDQVIDYFSGGSHLVPGP